MTRYLSQRHRDELHASGLTDGTIELADLETEKDFLEVCRILGWSAPIRWRTNQEGDWLRFPHYEPGSTEPYAVVVKPDHPRNDAKRNRAIKYEAPRGCESPVYYGPRARLGGRLGKEGLKIWTEGAKKALLLDQLGYTAIGLSGVWNAHDSVERKNTGQFILHSRITQYVCIRDCRNVIAFDSDARDKPDVMKAARVLARMLLEAGAVDVRIALPPSGARTGEKLGIDDYYMEVERLGECGADAIKALFGEAEQVDLSRLDTRPRIVLGTDEHRVVDEASTVLASAEGIYCRSEQLVRVVRADSPEEHDGVKRDVEAPSIRTLPIATLRETLTRHARIVRVDDTGEVDAHPPKWLADALAARGYWPGIRELQRVVDGPLLRRDGSVMLKNGYDAATRSLIALDESLSSLELPDCPTQADAKAAGAHLLDLVADFPFESEADRAAWLAGVLTSLAREAIRGPVPMFVVDAASRATGKTLLAQCASALVTGREAGVAGYTPDSNEMSKRLTSIAKQGDPLILFDNVDGELGDAALDRALTCTVWRERLLGTNDEPTYAFHTVIWATANNASVQGDTTRRVIPIRLVSPLEDPEHRANFRYPDLIAQIKQHRCSYIRDGLVILRAFIQAGMPTEGLGRLGSFEDWVTLVAGAVRFAIGVNPLESRKSLHGSQSETQLEALRALLRGLVEMGAMMTSLRTGTSLKAKEVLVALHLDDPRCALRPVLQAAREGLEELVRRPRPDAPIEASRLGQVLGRYVGRAVRLEGIGTVRLRADSRQGTKLWSVEAVQTEQIAAEQNPSTPEVCGGDRGDRGDFSGRHETSAEERTHSMNRSLEATGIIPTVPTIPTAPLWKRVGGHGISDDHVTVRPEIPNWTVNTLGDVEKVAQYVVDQPELLARSTEEPANDNAQHPTLPCEVRDLVTWYRKHPMEAARDAARSRRARRKLNSRPNTS